LVGWVVEFWPLATGDGYEFQAYQNGISLLLAAQIFYGLWFLAARHDMVRVT